MKFTELAKQLKEGLNSVYLIEGEEAYFRDHATEAIRAACGITQPTFNDVRFDGESLKGELAGFVADLYTVPFFDEKRLVRAYEFYPTEREWEKFLKPYAEDPCPSTVLVIVNGGKKQGAAELKRKKGITVVDCSRESEETLARWLFGVARKSGLNAESDAAALMVRYCARDAARMKKEIEKLSAILGEGGRVTRAAVEEYVAKDAEYKIYELTQAASRRNFAEFSEILSDMLGKGWDENAALVSLVSHYRVLYEASSSRASDAELAKSLGVKPYAVQRNRETAARLGREKVKETYRRLYELSCGARNGLYTKAGALSAAIAEIFFG